MSTNEGETRPGILGIEQGHSILDGPDGVAVAMTPDAAAETGRRLNAARDTVIDARGGATT